MGKENVLRFSLTVLSFKSVSIQLLRLFINVVVFLVVVLEMKDSWFICVIGEIRKRSRS